MSERKLLFLMTAEQTETFVRLLAAAERGDGGAACRLGDMYRVGEGGLRYSPKETYRWYAKSALTGDSNGQNNLGACYEHGLGCVQSYVKAVRWYRLSAAQRLGTASMNLGYCYLNGHGVPANKAEALRLFRLAVEQGEEKATQEVERLESGSVARVSQPVVADTPPVRPCRLALGVPPRDGPRRQLRHSDTGPNEPVVDSADMLSVGDMGKSKVRWVQGVEFVDEAAPGNHFGLVRVGGVAPWEDEQIRGELVEILKCGAETAHTPETNRAEAYSSRNGFGNDQEDRR